MLTRIGGRASGREIKRSTLVSVHLRIPKFMSWILKHANTSREKCSIKGRNRREVHPLLNSKRENSSKASWMLTLKSIGQTPKSNELVHTYKNCVKLRNKYAFIYLDLQLEFRIN